jgi:hypothetical protein
MGRKNGMIADRSADAKPLRQHRRCLHVSRDFATRPSHKAAGYRKPNRHGAPIMIVGIYPSIPESRAQQANSSVAYGLLEHKIGWESAGWANLLSGQTARGNRAMLRAVRMLRANSKDLSVKGADPCGEQW